MAVKRANAQGLDAALAVRTLLQHIKEDPDRDGLRDTPARVVRALVEMTGGYAEDPAKILSCSFDVDHNELVLVQGIRFVSLCEHHILPFGGVAHVAYIPNGRVVGLSKLARLVHCFARRLQVQERLTEQIATALMEHAKATGVGVILKAKHSCMGCRGVRQPDAEMVTSVMLGALREVPAARAELLGLLALNQGSN